MRSLLEGLPFIWPCDLVFDPKWPSFELDLEILKTNILSKIHDDCFKNVTASVNKIFPLTWPGDLVFYPTWPSFELDLEIIKTNILSKTHDDCFKNVIVRVLTRFSADLARWPSFWPQVTQFRTWPRTHQDKPFWGRFMRIASKMWPLMLTWFAFDWSGDLVFLSQVTQFWTWPRKNQDKHFEQDSWWLLQNCDR